MISKETMSSKQTICTIVLFLIGTNLVVGINTSARQDSWISFVLASVMAIPLFILYARIRQLNTEENMEAFLMKVFGDKISKIFFFFYLTYSTYLGALILKNFSEFIESVAMPETPQIPVIILIVTVGILMTKHSVAALGKWCVVIVPFIVMIVVLTLAFLTPSIKLDNFQPVGGAGAPAIFKGALTSFSFPYGEAVLIFGLSGRTRKGESSYKIYLWALLITAAVLLLGLFRNIAVLGVPYMSDVNFPSYIVARIINIGDFLTRLEGSISFNFIVGGIVKLVICILVASNCIAYIFNYQDQKAAVLPAGMLMTALAAYVYNNIMEMFHFIDFYFYYALPFQVILPLIIWITAELQYRKSKKAE